MASIATIHPRVSSSSSVRSLFEVLHIPMCFNCTNWNRRVNYRKFVVKTLSSDEDRSTLNDVISIDKSENGNAKKPHYQLLDRLQEAVGSAPVFIVSINNKFPGANVVVGLCIITTMLVVLVRGRNARKTRHDHQGSVADLVRRGQLRSDRRGISTPLKYEDPFNNPMVKVSKNNSTVEMCGKVYRLAPVTLTDEIQTVHQRRRSRAYQWKRPTVFLKEGESIPPDVDPDTVRWIPANHPFATTSSDIDEDLAQTNVYQKHGVPFRIQAEHEALQRKFEALQNEQKLNKLVIDPATVGDLDRPLKSQMKSENLNNTNLKSGSSHPTSGCSHNPSGNNSISEEMDNPFLNKST